MKRSISLILSVPVVMMLFTGCGKSSDSISVITREESSGTRSAFVELFEITDENGNDAISEAAELTNSTSVVITSVEGNENAIGYVSLGSLSDTVKGVAIDGAKPTVENINNGSYTVVRPFNLAYKDGSLSDLCMDFISFVQSKQGQDIIEKKGYIRQSAGGEYTPAGLSGKITLAGSTSVAPVIDAIAGEYEKLNKNVSIEIQQSGSSAGITSALEGASDIAMSSRELKDDEKSALTSVTVAKDGIAVIINKSNDISDLSKEQIRKIFSGEIASWAELG